jgi:uncharacterized protein YbbC (DUF1343 family)
MTRAVARLLAALAAGMIASGLLGATAHAQSTPAESPKAANVQPAMTEAGKVLTGIDVLAASGFAPLKGLRVGLLTNPAGRTRSGQSTIDALAGAPGVTLAALFSPEHGLDGDREGDIESRRDARTGLPVHSLYGTTRRPLGFMLAGLDAVVIDLQDVGVRFYTYATTMAYILEAAAKRKLKVIVLDRPNPIGAAGVRGPLPDPDVKSFTNYFRLPVQHGMTLGELGRLFNAERRIGADLTVIAMQGYARASWYDETGLAWVAPSPNLRSLAGTTLYPGVGLIEDTNVSVGRGTPTPFEVIGAPWMDGPALAAALQRRGIAGVRFASAAFTPTASRYAGRRCNGIRIELTDRAALDASRLGIELAVALRKLHPDRFAVRDMFRLLASREILAAIEAGEDPAAIERRWQPGLRAFMELRAKYLLY